MNPRNSMRRCLTFAVMAATVMLTGCCSDKSVEQRLRSLSGPDYLGLQRGQVHQAVTPEAWVAYRVVRAKDEQILDLLEALHKCQARSAMAPSVQPMAPGVPAASPDPAASNYLPPPAGFEPVVVPQKMGN